MIDEDKENKRKVVVHLSKSGAIRQADTSNSQNLS